MSHTKRGPSRVCGLQSVCGAIRHIPLCDTWEPRARGGQGPRYLKMRERDKVVIMSMSGEGRAPESERYRNCPGSESFCSLALWKVEGRSGKYEKDDWTKEREREGHKVQLTANELSSILNTGCHSLKMSVCQCQRRGWPCSDP